MRFRRAFTFNRHFIWKADRGRSAECFLFVLTSFLLFVGLHIACWSGAVVQAAQQLPKSAGGFAVAVEDVPASDLRILQNIRIGIGTFRGDRQAFIKYEDAKVPSLNPDIQVEGRMQLRTWLNADTHLRLQTSFAGEGKTSFGVGWRDWDAEYGTHFFNFSPAGLAYTKSSEGLRVRYRQPRTGPGLDFVAARSNARRGEVTIRGDDTFGPFFLGQKRIVPESEVVEVDGRRLRRGAVPGEGDYSMDYDGGFIYFHDVLLSHQTARVTYDYYFDDPSLASDFIGALAAYALGDTTVRAFVMRDYTPVEKHPIVDRPGTTLLAYGAHAQTTWTSGARLTNNVIATDFQEQLATTREEREQLALREGRTVYKLRRRPVLYESERIVLTAPGEGAVELMRYLDYTVDYHTGEVTLSFEPTDGAAIVVWYEYVDGTVPEKKPPLRGVQTENRFEYRGERWRTSTWLHAVDGQYVNVSNRRQPSVILSAGTQNRYGLGGGWGLLGDLTWTEHRTKTGVQTAFGVDYESVLWESRLQLERDVDVSDFGTTHLDYVQGSLQWRGAAHVEVDFKQQLDTYRGGVPEQFKASVTGFIGPLPGSVSYTRGDRHYNDKLEARLTLPAQGRHTIGNVTFGTMLLYADGFAAPPRTVHTAAGDVTYSGLTGMYVRAQGNVSRSAFGPVTTRAYVLRTDVGRSLGTSGVIDYQLRANGRHTDLRFGAMAQPQRSDESYSLSHVVTLAGTVLSGTNVVLSWRQTEGNRWRPDRGRTVSTERGWQWALQRTFGFVDANVSYDTSETKVTGRSTADLTTKRQRARFGLGWEKGPFSIRGSFEYARFDKTRNRRAVQLTPAYDLTENARLIIAYDYITSETKAASLPSTSTDVSFVRDANGLGNSLVVPTDGDYEVHTVRTGIELRF